jgi:hypothetical protein
MLYFQGLNLILIDFKKLKKIKMTAEANELVSTSLLPSINNPKSKLKITTIFSLINNYHQTA